MDWLLLDDKVSRFGVILGLMVIVWIKREWDCLFGCILCVCKIFFDLKSFVFYEIGVCYMFLFWNICVMVCRLFGVVLVMLCVCVVEKWEVVCLLV